MKITILQSGYVTGDLLNPVAYAGEMNSRSIEITHPLFENCYYQLLILKENRPYVLGIIDGATMLPPSLTDIACTLECQFMALRKNGGIDLDEGTCGCYPISSNDCSNMIFKSDKFLLKVAEGLNINGLTPIPPYEQLVDLYNNLSKAKLSIELSKADNQRISDEISGKISDFQYSNSQLSLNKEKQDRINSDKTINDKLDALINSINSLTLTINEKSLYRINYYDDETLLETQLKRYNESINIINLIPTKDDFTFNGWMDKNSSKIYNSNEIYNLNKDLDLYAIWK